MFTGLATKQCCVVGAFTADVVLNTLGIFQCRSIDIIQTVLNIFKVDSHVVSYYGPEQPEQPVQLDEHEPEHPLHLPEHPPEQLPEQPEQPEHPVEHPPVQLPVHVDVQVPEQLVQLAEQPLEHDQLQVPPQSSCPGVHPAKRS